MDFPDESSLAARPKKGAADHNFRRASEYAGLRKRLIEASIDGYLDLAVMPFHHLPRLADAIEGRILEEGPLPPGLRSHDEDLIDKIDEGLEGRHRRARRNGKTACDPSARNEAKVAFGRFQRRIGLEVEDD